MSGFVKKYAVIYLVKSVDMMGNAHLVVASSAVPATLKKELYRRQEKAKVVAAVGGDRI